VGVSELPASLHDHHFFGIVAVSMVEAWGRKWSALARSWFPNFSNPNTQFHASIPE